DKSLPPTGIRAIGSGAGFRERTISGARIMSPTANASDDEDDDESSPGVPVLRGARPVRRARDRKPLSDDNAPRPLGVKAPGAGSSESIDPAPRPGRELARPVPQEESTSIMQRPALDDDEDLPVRAEPKVDVEAVGDDEDETPTDPARPRRRGVLGARVGNSEPASRRGVKSSRALREALANAPRESPPDIDVVPAKPAAQPTPSRAQSATPRPAEPEAPADAVAKDATDALAVTAPMDVVDTPESEPERPRLSIADEPPIEPPRSNL